METLGSRGIALNFPGAYGLVEAHTYTFFRSRFTETQAQEFSQDWTVVEHIANTSTGFSGTLFQALHSDPHAALRQAKWS